MDEAREKMRDIEPLHARIAELEAALNLADKLAINVLGSWDAFEPALRSDIGNTNYRCVAEKVAEYRAARARIAEMEAANGTLRDALTGEMWKRFLTNADEALKGDKPEQP